MEESKGSEINDAEMGSCACKHDSMDIGTVDDESLPGIKPPLAKSGSLEQYAWEQSLIDDTLLKNSPVTKAAVVGIKHGVLKAWSPPDFTPDKQAITDILAAFEGDIEGLAERCIDVGCGVNVAVPGKIYEDRAIYGNDGHGGGTSVFRTDESVVIIVFEKDPATSNRLGLRTATFMKQYGR